VKREIRTEWFLLLTFAAVVFLRAPESMAGAEMKKASFIPQWSPQAQFAGYYVAYEKGFYRQHGIALKIIQGGPNRSSTEYLKKGEADFATTWLPTAIRLRSQGEVLVNIGQIVQTSALMLIARKANGILRPSDLEGKKVGLWGGDFSIQPRAFLRKHGLKVKVIPQSSSVNLFLRGGVDAASAMWYNEYHTIINSGVDPEELTTFFFDKYGLNFPEDGIYAREELCLKDPELCSAFLKASLQGWDYAFSHQEEALDIVMKYMSAAKIPASRTHQKWMLNRMKDIIMKGGSRPGMLDRKDYETVCSELQKAGLIKKAPEFTSFYRGKQADAQ
jgi:NitT/TauT family transport system substrate-binding protein